VIGAGLTVGSACGSGDEALTDRSVTDGVEHILFRGSDVPLGWKFDTDLEITPASSAGIAPHAVQPWEVGADRDGRVYLLDPPAGKIIVFGRSGRVVGDMGRSGAPGELIDPVALAISDEGAVAAYDDEVRGIVLWGASGEKPRVEPLEPVFWGPDLGLASWGVLFPTLSPGAARGETVQLVAVAATRTGILAELARSTVTASFPECGLVDVPVEPIFEPRIVWGLGKDVVAVTAGPRYEIAIFRRGVLERTIARDIAPLPASRELALSEAGDGVTLGAPVACRVSPEALVDRRGFEATIPVISGLAVAPDGTIWTTRGGLGDEGASRIDVFAASGEYLGTLPPGSPSPVAFAGGATDYRVVSIRSEEAGGDAIVIHRIVRPSARPANQ
jgi:hypothetical protein